MPQTSPSTTIGAPTADVNPAARTASATVPRLSGTSSIRTGALALRTAAARLASSTGQLLPTWNTGSLCAATTWNESPGS